MITVERIRTSDGKRPNKGATPAQIANMEILAERVNALLADLGVIDDGEITDGLRPENADYGAKRSAHKEGKALDLSDTNNVVGLRITNALLRKHRLRREDTLATINWLHLDTREPYGVFLP